MCGGSAMPRSMIKAFVDMGVTVRHAWGMNRDEPDRHRLASLKPPFADLEGEARLDILQTQGYPPFGVQMKITDDAGKDLPWDGKTFGRLKVRGPCGIAKAYFLRRPQPNSRQGRLFRHRRRRDHRPSMATCGSPIAQRT